MGFRKNSIKRKTRENKNHQCEDCGKDCRKKNEMEKQKKVKHEIGYGQTEEKAKRVNYSLGMESFYTM